MEKLNTKRLLIGGFVAGLVIEILEAILNIAVIGDEMRQVMEATGMEPASTGLFLLVLIWAWLSGFLGVWMYARLRPSMGAGPMTAIRVGVLIWFFAYLFYAMMSFAEAIVPSSLIWTILVWRLVETPVAILIGAMLYKDA
jgi:hypothetical protein